MANYATAQAVSDKTKNLVAPEDIQQDWLDHVDELIEYHAGGGWKGAQREVDLYGDGNQYIRLPSEAAGIVSLAEEGTVLDPTTYGFWMGKRNIRRLGVGGLFTQNPYTAAMRPVWYEGMEYIVSYTEPAAPSKRVQQTAAEAVATIAMWAQKYKIAGIASAATKSGSQGGGSVNTTTSYPPDLVAAVNNVIKQGLPKEGY